MRIKKNYKHSKLELFREFEINETSKLFGGMATQVTQQANNTYQQSCMGGALYHWDMTDPSTAFNSDSANYGPVTTSYVPSTLPSYPLVCTTGGIG